MVEIRALSPVLAKKARDELNETPENIEHKLKALREWVISQTHFRSRTNDQFLIVFLRGAKFSLERAKQKLENYYVYKLKIPELYYGRNPCDPKVHTILKLGCLLYLPQPISPDGPSVAIIRPNRFDMTQHSIADVFMVGAMATDILIQEDDNAIIAGYIVVMDLKDLPRSVIYSFNPNFARKLTVLVNKISPTRMKGFHFLNVPTVFTKLFNMVKSVISEKLRDRFYVHDGSLESLYEHIPRHILPKTYGGEYDDTEFAETWCRRLQESADFLKEEETYGVIGEIENARKCRQSIESQTFGCEGSFRSLSID